ncbi:MAG TPA: cysteine synthase family protein [Acidobacteriota bacterium]|nr:cysteine synthase family protein [Acidobacteriota bacterium]
MRYESILQTIGHTPLVRINKIWNDPKVEIWAKLEGWNPMGSVKERPALWIVEGAERDGSLVKGMTILESSSGNTGIGLALVGAVKGYPVTIVMPQKVSRERRQILRALGAEIVFTSEKGGSDEAWEIAERLARENPTKYFYAQQYSNKNNTLSHFEGTAMEIWDDMKGDVDVATVTLGTCGTIMGLSHRLKQLKPSTRIVAIEPQKAHHQQGLRNMDESRKPDLLDWKWIDEKIVIEDEEAFDLARRLASEEGIFSGISCGTALAGSIRVAKTMKQGKIVTIFPDRGEKYFSITLFPE